jgi:hypothetical protein
MIKNKYINKLEYARLSNNELTYGIEEINYLCNEFEILTNADEDIKTTMIKIKNIILKILNWIYEKIKNIYNRITNKISHFIKIIMSWKDLYEKLKVIAGLEGYNEFLEKTDKILNTEHKSIIHVQYLMEYFRIGEQLYNALSSITQKITDPKQYQNAFTFIKIQIGSKIYDIEELQNVLQENHEKYSSLHDCGWNHDLLNIIFFDFQKYKLFFENLNDGILLSAFGRVKTPSFSWQLQRGFSTK